MYDKIISACRATRGYIYKHSPEILTAIGITGMVTSTVLAVKATPEAISLIESKEKELNDRLTWKETIIVAWRPYLPAAITCGSSIICLIGACAVNSRRNAALTTAYGLSQKAFSSYRDEVIKTIGEKKEKNIRDNVAQKDVDNNPVLKDKIVITSKGNTLCRDSISGRYFRSDLETLRKNINEINRRLMIENFISLNEYYSSIGLDGIKEGDILGWDISAGLIELDFDACITDTDEACIVIDYNIMPNMRYGQM